VSEPAPRQSYNVTLAVLATSALCYALSQTMLAPALPRIQEELGTSTTDISWVLTAFLLSASISTPILGRLGDMFGKKRMLMLTLILFTLGSLIGALSHSIEVLLLARFVQGFSSGVFPLAYGIVRDEFPAEKAASGIGLVSGTFGIGGGIGLACSGAIVDNLSYEWIFWISGAVALLTLAATRLWVPESPSRNPGRIDWMGAGLLAGGLATLLIAITEVDSWGWTGTGTLALFAASMAILAAWAAYESRIEEPLVDMKLFRERGVPTTNLSSALLGFGMFSSFILIPQFVQTPSATGTGFGASVTGAGLFMLPSTLLMLVAGPAAGSLATRWGAKLPLVIGALFMVAGFAAMGAFHGGEWEMLAGSLVMGWGLGMAFASMANMIVELVPRAQTGEATGMNTIMRTIGGALGAQISASILVQHLASGGPTSTDAGYTLAFAVSGLAALLGALVALRIPGPLFGERAGKSQRPASTPAEAA
jgi:EmrB/QacA subfamily drug resistance transporter